MNVLKSAYYALKNELDVLNMRLYGGRAMTVAELERGRELADLLGHAATSRKYEQLIEKRAHRVLLTPRNQSLLSQQVLEAANARGDGTGRTLDRFIVVSRPSAPTDTLEEAEWTLEPGCDCVTREQCERLIKTLCCDVYDYEVIDLECLA